MTYSQFKTLVEGIGKKLNWDLKLTIASASPEVLKSLKSEDYPLFSKSIEDEKVFKMKDALAFKGMAQKG